LYTGGWRIIWSEGDQELTMALPGIDVDECQRSFVRAADAPLWGDNLSGGEAHWVLEWGG
jgi:hypothetical protein